MKLIWWMLAGSLLTAAVLALFLVPDFSLEVWLGMLGPLISAIASWAAMQRQFTRSPERLTALMIKAFGAKMIFFAVYITVLVVFGSVHPIPFVISFACYFIALHGMEAFGLRRLQFTGMSEPPARLQGQLKNG
jgi:hypothetical protein